MLPVTPLQLCEVYLPAIRASVSRACIQVVCCWALLCCFALNGNMIVIKHARSAVVYYICGMADSAILCNSAVALLAVPALAGWGRFCTVHNICNRRRWAARLCSRLPLTQLKHACNSSSSADLGFPMAGPERCTPRTTIQTNYAVSLTA